MTPRERYIQTLTFGTPDKIPFHRGGPRESTRKRWESEGLANGDRWLDALFDELGFAPEPTKAQVYSARVIYGASPREYRDELLRSRMKRADVRDDAFVALVKALSSNEVWNIRSDRLLSVALLQVPGTAAGPSASEQVRRIAAIRKIALIRAYRTSRQTMAPDSAVDMYLRGIADQRGASTQDFQAAIEQTERELLENALAASGGNKTAAAAALGMKPSTFRDKLAKHGLG